MDIKQKVGHRIRELRKQLELSQEGLAYKAEVDRTYVTDVENGRRNVSLEILEKLIKALKISISEFFNSAQFRK
jgi:transcriptional regulator with XRE-family HTH domain